MAVKIADLIGEFASCLVTRLNGGIGCAVCLGHQPFVSHHRVLSIGGCPVVGFGNL